MWVWVRVWDGVWVWMRVWVRVWVRDEGAGGMTLLGRGLRRLGG